MARLNADRAQRLARARAVLHAVETSKTSSPFAKASYRAEPLVVDHVSTASATSARSAQQGKEGLQSWHEVIPEQLRHSSIVNVAGSVTVLLAALSEVMNNDGQNSRWAAVLGMPEIGLMAASEQGVDLERLIVVPELETQGAEIIAAALDGVDIVVCGPKTNVGQAQQRKITARVRRHNKVLLSTYPWQHADLTLQVVKRRWWGTDQGHGWLQHAEAEIARSGRGTFAQPMRGNLDLLGRAAG